MVGAAGYAGCGGVCVFPVLILFSESTGTSVGEKFAAHLGAFSSGNSISNIRFPSKMFEFLCRVLSAQVLVKEQKSSWTKKCGREIARISRIASPKPQRLFLSPRRECIPHAQRPPFSPAANRPAGAGKSRSPRIVTPARHFLRLRRSISSGRRLCHPF